VTFENSLKIDTPATVSELKDAGIDCKMITGDGIFIAVQTAVRAGIIHSKEKILVIEGRKQVSNA
jgi:P-type E1-E2 ATPase